MSDNNSFLRVNRFPVDYMIQLLQYYFKPDAVIAGYVLVCTGERRLTNLVVWVGCHALILGLMVQL
jgi:hypothetical protein